MTNKTKTFEPTIPFDSVLAKAILESYYTGQCFENGGGDWVPDEFLDSELSASNASLAAVNFHHRLLKHHGCFMELNPGD